MNPAEPNTYEAECMSDRGVVARRVIMITKIEALVNLMNIDCTDLSALIVAPMFMKTNEEVKRERYRVPRQF
jgi:hypothetical protein